jgi:hypothetical protein
MTKKNFSFKIFQNLPKLGLMVDISFRDCDHCALLHKHFTVVTHDLNQGRLTEGED